MEIISIIYKSHKCSIKSINIVRLTNLKKKMISVMKIHPILKLFIGKVTKTGIR